MHILGLTPEQKKAIGASEQAGMVRSGPITYGGFRRRFLAFLIDAILVGILGGVIASWDVVSDVLVVPTFPIALLYFTFGYGKAFGGRTIGKGFLELRVVDLNGDVPDYRRSLIRAAPIAYMLSADQIVGRLDQLPELLVIPTSIAGFIAGAAIFIAIPIALIFRQEKRGIHDMLAGTASVRTGTSVKPLAFHEAGSGFKAISLIVAGVLIVGVVTSVIFEGPVNPLVASWQDEGIVEDVEFVESRVSSPTSGTFNVLEIRATVPTGTLDDGPRAIGLMTRLATDINIPIEVDMVAVIFTERTGSAFFWTCREKYRGFSPTGKEDILERA